MRKVPRAVWVVLALVAVGFMALQIRSFFSEPVANGHLPAEFPHAFLAPADNGKPAAVVVWRGRTPPATLDAEGVRRFPVAVCRNPECPGLKNGQPFIFARGFDPALKPGPSGTCPACAATQRDATQVETWYTPEADAILVRVRTSLGAD